MAIKREDKVTYHCCLTEKPSDISKTKQFVALALFELKCRQYILITGLTDVLTDAIIEQLSKLINSSLTINLKLSFRVYWLKKKGYVFCKL